MRILHVVESLDAKAGGPPLIALRTAAAQALRGHGADLLSYDFDSVNEPGADRAADLSLTRGTFPGGDLVGLKPVRASGRRERLFASAASRDAGAIIRDYDFVHLNGVWSPMLAAVAAQAHGAGIPYCVTIHGMLHPWSLSQGRLKKRVALRLRYRRMLDRAAFLQLGNRHEQMQIAALGLKAPVEIVPNGVFMEIYNNLPPRDAFHAEHPELGGQPYILFLSRLHYKKGLDILAEAFAHVASRVPNVRLVVAGPDDGDGAGFAARVKALGVGERVHVTGPLFNEQKFKALSGAACFCLPSRQEGFSVAITEAMASGLACVVSEDCFYPEVAEVGAGEVVPLDPRAVGDALVRVLTAKNRSAMGENGRRLVRERFTWHAVAARTLDLYARYAGAAPIALSRARADDPPASMGA